MLSFETNQNQVEHIDGMTIEFPYCMHQRDLTDFTVPWHWHEELELGYIEKGTSIIRTLTQEYTIHQGDGFFINTNIVDTKLNGNPGKTTIEVNHIFHPIFIGGHFGSLITSKYLNPVLQNQNLSVYVIRRGTKETNTILNNLALLKDLNGKENQEIAIRNLLSETWILLLAELKKNFISTQDFNIEKQDQIKSMLFFIHKNYNEKITLAEIAKNASISTRKANRLFQEVIHQTPFEYLMHYRLNRTRELLENTDLSITEISYQCGFTDSTYMGKQFKKIYNETPTEYRKKYNNTEYLE